MTAISGKAKLGGETWLIAGPTASGKSALALALAERTGAAVVNADSMQLYRDLRVLTARPSEAEGARAPHRLYGVADAAERWSAGRWLRAAEAVMGEVAAERRPAVVVGGTGLYFRALTEGLASVPHVPHEVRVRSSADFEALGEAAFRARLAVGDPESAARIAAGDRQRLVRAWEVLVVAGAPLGALPQTPPVLAPGAWRGVVLEPPRSALYARCDARAQQMAGRGAVEEAAALLARGLSPELPAMKAIGVRAFEAVARGELELAAAVATVAQDTRRYAKRQMTWFRNQTPSWARLAEPDVDALLGL